MDLDLVIKTLADFGDVFDCIPPYQPEGIISARRPQSGDIGGIPGAGPLRQTAPAEQNDSGGGTLWDKNWLPGLVSQSVVMWDRVRLEWTRMAKRRLKVRLLTARP